MSRHRFPRLVGPLLHAYSGYVLRTTLLVVCQRVG
jgi:hypothetical protein